MMLKLFLSISATYAMLLSFIPCYLDIPISRLSSPSKGEIDRQALLTFSHDGLPTLHGPELLSQVHIGFVFSKSVKSVLIFIDFSRIFIDPSGVLGASPTV
ncbi:uncharacterized protein DS421_15g497810 [Arachis hypogaea]|nr:uncharacterized protein DS421_15g497810 [Arachis hypogaea]